ncbi:excinuclease ABC subunit UvrA [Pseudodesulfovibrio piezophilus]|uniref:UvrABC system protein A n=1 Tax=Pseudodesulfovibrio piezophilus (strain DSM 21447 / JCM 15486 / C1TLV30) TaxID=1322246 RepID=M1WM67_PSEP2|nr:excinuclease ABC subunit UvrA [Pseudodesulfovibrio piezophilus]CCH49075.1 UvrABC system protein A [Pseudodesulfovibrio piezophilus C1TLV30]
MTKSAPNHSIHIEGARHHNLKDLTLDIPRDKLVVVCGPSGSGKSTLAFDIVYAEGQRRYVESLSAYARQFLPQMDKPDVDKVEGLSPAISLEQQTATRNPRSTVGTVTEVYDFLRVFYARLGKFYCPKCGKPIEAQTTDQIVKTILAMEEGTKLMLLAPLVEHQKGTHKDLFSKLKKDGFVRVRVGGQIYPIDEVPDLEKHKKHTIDLVIDRLVIKDGIKKRLADSVELALEHGEERMIVTVVGGNAPGDTFMSTLSTCPACKISMPRLTPQLFSFNSPQGACPTCNGIGSVEYFEPDLISPNKGLSLNQGGVIPWKSAYRQEQYGPQLKKLGKKHGFTLDTPLSDYTKDGWDALFHGCSETGWPGIVPILEYGQQQSGVWDHWTARYKQSTPCPACHGARLRPEVLAVRVADKNMFEFASMSIQRALDWLNGLNFTGQETLISEPLLKELTHKLGFMVNVGLEYISLGRNMSTLSGGEAQRIRLASQLGSGLVGVTYVLDEPSIGLHPRDNQRLIDTLRSLQTRGNTVLVVEHDEPTILEADHVIEIGPSSGWLGGEIVFQGPVDKLLKADTLTGKYLRGDIVIEPPETRRTPTDSIVIKNVETNNLKNLDVDIPLGVMTCVTGVSGSGKSSLVMDSLYKHLQLFNGNKADNPGKIGGIEGLDKIEKVISIDQTPIGRTPRSNPATYTKIFDEIRKIFTGSKEARTRGYKPGRFSFNVKGGRCEACKGDGQIRVEMHFLPDVYVTCETCKGKRYNAQTLEVEYKGKNIADVLDMTVRQAREFFANHPPLMRRLDVLSEVGLDYIKLGQAATTLSGGEAQRIKISRELGKRNLPGALYILDEPTTGLHMHEVGKLIRVLHALVDKGATVIVIEHNTDVINGSDHVIDLGPGGGEHGGQIVASGTPEEIIANPNSVTGAFLKK